ncbi:MAG: lipopolysaccharide kinase InaA family protein [Halioglobus sp.]
MINRMLVIDGKRWGHRLAERLRQPPMGIVAWMQRHTQVVKDDPARLVGYLRIRERHCFLKLYRRPSLLRKLLLLMRIGRPLRTYKTGLVLAANGVLVPRPLSCAVVAEGALLLTEGLSGGGDYCQLWDARPSRDTLSRMMRGAGESIADLHVVGYTHGDCKWSNLLWSEERCYLVDLDGARRPRLLAASRRARDLARFTISAEEAGVPAAMLEEFLDSYLRKSGVDRDTLVRRMQPHLQKLRGRHLHKYGVEPHPLL